MLLYYETLLPRRHGAQSPAANQCELCTISVPWPRSTRQFHLQWSLCLPGPPGACRLPNSLRTAAHGQRTGTIFVPFPRRRSESPSDICRAWYKIRLSCAQPYICLTASRSQGTCEIWFHTSGEQYQESDPIVINPKDIRNMAGWILDLCVSGRRTGGAITKGVAKATDWILDIRSLFPHRPMRESLHVLFIARLRLSVFRYQTFI